MCKYNTILGQILQLFRGPQFQKLVKETKSEYHSRGLTSWSHFVSMIFGQLCGQDSLRGIEAGLASQGNSLYHLNTKPVPRATLAYANAHRPNELFEQLFFYMLSKCQPLAPKHNFKFKNPLYSIDSTTIDLCLSLYDWAKFRTTKGAVKLHVKLNHAGFLPNFAIITEGNVHDQKPAWNMLLEKNDVVVFDKAYNNFNWFNSLNNSGVFFVTRLKDNADFKVIKRNDTSKFEYIYSDQTIMLKGILSKQKYSKPLRRIRSKDPLTGKIIVLLTNNFSWSANTIAKIYKERWQIELFFKSLKQQLKVKSFVGTSKNALLSQLWIALIAYLALCYLKFKSKFAWSVYTLSSIIPANLFARRNLWDWLNNPYGQPKSNSDKIQLSFSFG